MKISITNIEARNKAIKGMSYVAEAIKSTIGPHGLNFLLEKQNKITNDGYNISSELCPTIKDEFERRGALVAHEASARTNEEVGDATSTAWALTDAIVKEAIRYLPSEKMLKAQKTPAEIIKMIKNSKEEVIKELEKMAVPITDKETLIKSALVSVEDEDMAKLLGETQWELGPEGIIIAEEVNEPFSSVDLVKGIRFDNGWGTSYVVNNPEKQTLELNDVSILMTNYTIGIEELALLQKAVFDQLQSQGGIKIALIARAFTSEAIKMCMESMKTKFNVYPINAPYTDQNQVFKDMETIVGGRYIDNEESRLEDIYISDVGFAKRFVARRFDTVITGEDNEQTKQRIEKRVEVLKEKIKGEQSPFMKKMLEERVAQLTNGFAILKVGSISLTNRKRLKDKADDAVNAIRYALKYGTVKGGGLAFKEISDKMEEGNILKRPLLCIYNQIMSSAPEDFVIEDWVRDPMWVLKTALENAAEFASTFSSVNGIITSENPKQCYCGTKQQDE